MAVDIERLQQRLDKDLAWRKKEIVTIRGAVSRSTVSADHLCRAGVVILAAHWEGYLKSALQNYVDFVFSQNVITRDLRAVFVAVSYFADVVKAGQARYPGTEFQHIKLAERILGGVDRPCSKATWKVDTDGNPGSTTTADLLASVGLSDRLGLDDAEWSTAKVFIDEQLLKIRHKIAHGEGYKVSKDDFVSKSERTIRLCEAVSAVVIDGATQKSYLGQTA